MRSVHVDNNRVSFIMNALPKFKEEDEEEEVQGKEDKKVTDITTS